MTSLILFFNFYENRTFLWVLPSHPLRPALLQKTDHGKFNSFDHQYCCLQYISEDIHVSYLKYTLILVIFSYSFSIMKVIQIVFWHILILAHFLSCFDRLNAFSNTNSKGSGDADTESLSMSNQGRGDDSRRREEMFVPNMHRERSSQMKSKTNSTNVPKIKRKSSTVNRETLSSSARQTNVSTRTNRTMSGASSSGVASTRHITNTIPTNTKVSARQQSHQRSNLALASPSATSGHRGVTNGRQHMPISRLDEQLASSIESLGLINNSNYNHSDGYSPVFESQSLSDNRLLAPDYPHHNRSIARQPQTSGVPSQRPRSAPPSSPMSLKTNRSPAIEGKTRRASTSKGIADLNSNRSVYYNGTENRRNDHQEVDRDSKRDTRLVSNINSTLHSRNGRPPITPTYTSDKYHLNQYSFPHSAH
jgi:hypothetical protein